MLPHMDAAYALARRLMGPSRDAEDVVQEAYLRAFRFFGGFRGGDSRVWLLRIVRNACYDWLKRYRGPDKLSTEFREEVHSGDAGGSGGEMEMLTRIENADLDLALDRLAVEHREIIVLRELEGFSYKELAEAIGVPIGTVMSRLARARRLLKNEILRQRESPNGLR